jgi:hypothetical protein
MEQGIIEQLKDENSKLTGELYRKERILDQGHNEEIDMKQIKISQLEVRFNSSYLVRKK